MDFGNNYWGNKMAWNFKNIKFNNFSIPSEQQALQFNSAALNPAQVSLVQTQEIQTFQPNLHVVKAVLPQPQAVFPEGQVILPLIPDAAEALNSQLPQALTNPNIFPNLDQNVVIPNSMPLFTKNLPIKRENIISTIEKEKTSFEKTEDFVAEIKITLGELAQKLTPFLYNFGAVLPAVFTSAALSELMPSAIEGAALPAIIEKIKYSHQNKVYELKAKYPKLEKTGIFETLKKSICDYQLEFIEIIMTKNPNFNTKALRDFLENLSNPKITKRQLKWFKDKINQKIQIQKGKQIIDEQIYDTKDLFTLMSYISSDKDLAEKQFDWLDKNMPDKLDLTKMKFLATILKNLKPEIADGQFAWVKQKLEENPNIDNNTVNILNAVLSALKPGIVKEQTDWADTQLKANPKFNLEMLSAVLSSLKPNIINEQLDWADKILEEYPQINVSVVKAALSSLKPEILEKQINWVDEKLKENPKYSSELIRALLSNSDAETFDWKKKTFEKLISYNSSINSKDMNEFLKGVKPEIMDVYTLMIDELLKLYTLTSNNILITAKGTNATKEVSNFMKKNINFLGKELMRQVIVLNEILNPEIAQKQYECFVNYEKLFKFNYFQDIEEALVIPDALDPKNIEDKIKWLNSEIEKGNKRKSNIIYGLLRGLNPELIQEQVTWADNHTNIQDEVCAACLLYLKKGIHDKQFAWIEKKFKERSDIHQYIIAATMYSIKPDLINEQLDWVDEFLKGKGNKLDADKDSDVIAEILPHFQKELFERQKKWVNDKLEENKIDSTLIGIVLQCMTPELADRQFFAAERIFKQNPDIPMATLKKYLQDEQGLDRLEDDFINSTGKRANKKRNIIKQNNDIKEKLNHGKVKEQVKETPFEEMSDESLKEMLDNIYLDNDEFLSSNRLCSIYEFWEKDMPIEDKREMLIDFIKILEKEKNIDKICQSEVFLSMEKFINSYNAMEKLYNTYRAENRLLETSIPQDFATFILDFDNLNIAGVDNISKSNIIAYLMKLSDWFNSDKCKTNKLNDFIKLFDVDDCVEKNIIEYYVENFYINTDFQTVAKGNNNRKENVTITSKAKQAVYDKYKSQDDYYFLRTFERAASIIVPPKGTTGIKEYPSSDETVKGKKEIKISGHNDRIFNNNDDSFVFDIFDENGDH